MQNIYHQLEVIEFLNKLEKDLNITILYACETGSRAVGTDVEESDYDVKGFYIAKENEYLKIVRLINPVHLQHHMKIKIQDREYDIDVELIDLQKYFRNKIDKGNTRSDFWFYSQIVYINKFNIEHLDYIKSQTRPPIFLFSDYDKSGIKTFEKKLFNHQKILNKKLLCLCISGIQFLHTVLYFFKQEKDLSIFISKFPFYNIFEEINYLNNLIQSFKYYFTDEEYEIIYSNLHLCKGLYLKKKQSRLSYTDIIPDNLKKFINFLTIKFYDKMKSNSADEYSEEFAEKVFNHYLYLYNFS